MVQFAAMHGWTVLSKRWRGGKNKYKITCPKGHKSEFTPDQVMRGRRCRECTNNQIKATLTKYDLNYLHRYAKSRGGVCLNKTYEGIRDKVFFRCHEGHSWSRSGQSIGRKQWCRKCARKKISDLRRDSIDRYIKIAKERGGHLLSKKYINSQTHLKWTCRNKHVFELVPAKAVQGSWCPECSKGLSERVCRAYFESIFGKKFPSSKPSWLVTERGHRMELDGYNADLKIAFEHQGEQHYSTGRLFMQNKAKLSYRKKLDMRKRYLCRKHGVSLICVPAIGSRLDHGDIKSYLKKKLTKLGLATPSKIEKIKISFDGVHNRDNIGELSKIASSKGGILVSNVYLGNGADYEWECLKGHRWYAPASRIKFGSWCLVCSGSEPYTIDEMRSLAKKRGGALVSKRMKNIREKLLWRCQRDHQWAAPGGSIVSGYWCQKCAAIDNGKKRRITMSVWQKIAKGHGGRCLSSKYVLGEKMKWRCQKKHTWLASPHSVKNGTWCRKCADQIGADNRRDSIAIFHKIASDRGGECLSKLYKSQKTKLKFSCSNGHKWAAYPNNVKRGSWCRKCVNDSRRRNK